VGGTSVKISTKVSWPDHSAILINFSSLTHFSASVIATTAGTVKFTRMLAMSQLLPVL